MFKISDFSKLSRISIRMLRYYDENDILKPMIVRENGYRYHDAKQLYQASHITYLRFLGFNTNQIKNILTICHDNQDILMYLQNQINEKINALKKTIKKMNQEDTMMNYQIEIKTIPEKYMMCKRGIIPSYDKEHLLWKGLMNELKETNREIDIIDHGTGMAIFYDEGYKDQDVDVEICLEVKGNYQDSEHIKFKTIPEIKVASITFTGSYERINDVTCEIAKWLVEHDYQICGNVFSIYHVGYMQSQNQEEFVTEICYPIK